MNFLSLIRFILRDTRRMWPLLLLCVLAIFFSVFTQTVVVTVVDSVEQAIKSQQQALAGADLFVESRASFSEDDFELFDSIDGAKSEVIRFASMARFGESKDGRLVQVQAIAGKFPFYGDFQTYPAEAKQQLYSGNGCLVDTNLALQFDVAVGDTISIGGIETKVIGVLKKIPGDRLGFSFVAPKVVVDRSIVQPLLDERGVVARHQYYFAFGENRSVKNTARYLQDRLPSTYRVQTSEQREETLSRPINFVKSFLLIAAILSLVVGGIGAALGVFHYVRRRRASFSMLKSLGFSHAQIVAFVVLQLSFVALATILVAFFAGVFTSINLLGAVGELVSLSIDTTSLPWERVFLQAVPVSFIVVGLFALVPASALKSISALESFRLRSAEKQQNTRVLLLVVLLTFSILIPSLLFFQGVSKKLALISGLVPIGLVIISSLLVLVLARVSRSVLQRSRFLPIRHAVLALSRPGSGSTILLVMFFILSFSLVFLSVTRSSLVSDLTLTLEEEQPNLVLIDVQLSEKAQINSIFEEHLEAQGEEYPVVSMRLSSIKGRFAADLLRSPKSEIPSWALQREYRSTYRNSLAPGEEIVAGTPLSDVSLSGNEIPVSIEERQAERLGVTLGDEMTFTIAGQELKTVVANIRSVEWRQMRPNFFVVFPDGTLDSVPQFLVYSIFTPNADYSAKLQKALVASLPSVSVVDVRTVLETFSSVLEKFLLAIFVVFAVLAISILIVLVVSVLGSFDLRKHDATLYKVLGMSNPMLVMMIGAEFFVVALIGLLGGTFAAVAAGYFYVEYYYEMRWAVDIRQLLLIGISILLATIFTGMISSWRLYRVPSSGLLRQVNS